MSLAPSWWGLYNKLNLGTFTPTPQADKLKMLRNAEINHGPQAPKPRVVCHSNRAHAPESQHNSLDLVEACMRCVMDFVSSIPGAQKVGI